MNRDRLFGIGLMRLAAYVLSMMLCGMARTYGAPFSQWFTIPLHDGRNVRIWGEGDEYSAHFESEDGHAVIFDRNIGGYVYVEKDDDTGALLTTDICLGDEVQHATRLAAIPLHLRDTSVAAREDSLRRIKEQDKLTGMSQRWNALKAARRQAMRTNSANRKQKDGTQNEMDVLPQSPSHETVGTVVGLALLIDFPSENDSNMTLAQQAHPNVTQSDIEGLFNAETFTKFGNTCSVRKYFKDVSYGRLCYTNIVVGWFMMPYPRSHYDDPTRGCGECARPLIIEAFRQMRDDPQYETKYEPLLRNLTLGDYSAPKAINVYFAGESAVNWNYGLWAHKSGFGGTEWGKAFYTVDGVQRNIYLYQISPITSAPCIGTVCHESGHMVCGFPDLYHYDEGKSGVGRFCLMDGSISNFDPQGINPYLRAAAGWIVPRELSANTEQTIVTCSLSDVWKWTNPKNEKEYFLIENRRKKGHDATLPGEGILIWRCNEERNNTDAEFLDSFAGTRRSNELSLEQADGQYHFERYGYWGNSEDTWYAGNTASTYGGVFNDASIPCAKWEDASDSGLQFSNFSDVGDTMSFSVGKVSRLPDLCFTTLSNGAATPFLTSQSNVLETATVFNAGAAIYLYCEFGNNGTADISSNYTIKQQLLDSLGNELSSTSWTSTSATWLRIGAELGWYGTAMGILQGLPVGNYTYRCTLDSNGVITESNESNNVVEINFTVVAPPQTYTVTYKPGSYGTGSQQTVTKTKDVALTLKGETFTRTGYKQTGWTTSDGGSKAYNLGASYTSNADLTLYPFWTANTYSVSYAMNGGTHGTTHPTSTTYGTAFKVSEPTKSGSTFAGWTVTIGLNTSTAKYGTSSTSQPTAITSSSQKCQNGTVGDIWFLNLTATANGSVTLTANWTETPANDNFSSPVTISGSSGSKTGSNTEATLETSEVMPSARSSSTGSVWYKWTAPSTGTATFDTVGSGFDTVVGIYTGTSVSALTEIASNDDIESGNTKSRVTFSASSGTTYRIAVYGYSGANGSYTLNWSLAAQTITVSFVVNGGTSCANREYTVGGTYGSLPTTTKPGYAFGGWYTSSTFTTKVTAGSTVSASVSTLYAKWTANTYSVSYAMNGGTHGTTHPTSTTYGTAFKVSEPTKSGSTFAGWTVTIGLNTSTAKYGTSSTSQPTAITSSSQKCQNGTVGDIWFLNLTATANGSVTLTANWTAVATTTYTVTYNPGSFGTGSQQTVTKTKDVALTLKGAIFTRTGYTQTGWATSDGGSKAYNLGAAYTSDADLTLYPYWETESDPSARPKWNITADGVLTDVELNGVTDVVIPEGVTRIFPYAFAGLGITSVRFPSTLVTIGHHAFYECTALTNVTFSSGSALELIDSWAFLSCSSLRGVFEIPEGVGVVEFGVFMGSGVETLVFPSTLTYLGPQQTVYGTPIREVYFKGNAPRTEAPSSAYPQESSPYCDARPDLVSYVPFGSTGWKNSSSELPGVWPVYGGRPIRNYNGEPPQGISGSIGGETVPDTLDDVEHITYSGRFDPAFGKVQTVTKALCDKNGVLVGTVQLKAGKENTRKGTVKLSAKATLTVNGKATSVTSKAVMLNVWDMPISQVVLTFKKPIGAMTFSMKADLTLDGAFKLENASYKVVDMYIGGKWKRSDAKVYVTGRGALPPGTIADLFPNEESFAVKAGKWVFAKAAQVKYVKGQGLVVNDKNGKAPNRSALKLTYTPKTGLFKGAFKVYAVLGGKLKKLTAKVAGVVADGEGVGTAFIPKSFLFDVEVK